MALETLLNPPLRRSGWTSVSKTTVISPKQETQLFHKKSGMTFQTHMTQRTTTSVKQGSTTRVNRRSRYIFSHSKNNSLRVMSTQPKNRTSFYRMSRTAILKGGMTSFRRARPKIVQNN
jgi:hypothetical protein